MNIDDITIGQARDISTMFGRDAPGGVASDKIGKYVIVRCRDAGVHAGVLVWADGRACRLMDARRLWYWKPANNAAFLSGVANHGLDNSSKVGEPVSIDLTENCEIILCSRAAEASIREIKAYVKS